MTEEVLVFTLLAHKLQASWLDIMILMLFVANHVWHAKRLFLHMLQTIDTFTFVRFIVCMPHFTKCVIMTFLLCLY